MRENETIEEMTARLAAEEQAEKDAVERTMAAFDKEMAAKKLAQQAEKQAREQALADEAEAQRQRQAKLQQAIVKKQSQASWLASGGDPEEFEEQWPSLWRDYLKNTSHAEVRQRQANFNQKNPILAVVQ